MDELSATEAARRFSEMLDAIEHRHASFLIVRRGVPVARMSPAAPATGRTIKALIRRRPPDPAWGGDLRELRTGLTLEERRWNA